MIFSIVIILLVGLIAYFHYVQGLLSGIISAVLAVVAAMLAVGYYEPLSAMVSGGAFNDAAPGACLLAIFAVVYLLGRVLFDKLIPGNVRLPHIVDSVGGAVCGLVAGVFATGVIAIAFQSMPFAPAIFGYARYAIVTEPRQVTISTAKGQGIDRVVIDELKSETFEDKDVQGLLLPVDDIVVGMAERLSAGGSLAGARPLASVHPDLLQELFAQRIGVQVGARRSASNAKSTQVEVVGANVIVQPLKKTTGEFEVIYKPEGLKDPLKPEQGKRLVTLTVMFKSDAADTDKIVRLSPGSVRLVTKSGDGWANVYPLGTVQLGQLWLAKPDTPMFISTAEEDRGAHFLFLVDEGVFVANPNAKAQPGGKPGADAFALSPDVFLEVKRVLLPLEGVPVTVGMPPEQKKYYPMRKENFYKEDAKPEDQPTAAVTDRNPTPPQPAAPTGGPTKENGWLEAPLDGKPVMSVSTKLPVGISTGGPEADGDVATTAVSGHVTGRKFDILEVETASPAAAMAELSKGGNTSTEFWVPDGQRMIQIKMGPRAGVDSWAWAEEVGSFSIKDERNYEHRCAGAFAVCMQGGAQKLVAKYSAHSAMTGIPKVEGATVTEVTLLFLMPKDEKPKELQYKAATNQGGLAL